MSGKKKLQNRDIKAVYKKIHCNSDERAIIAAQKELNELYKTCECTFQFLRMRYYYLKAYEITLPTQVSYLFNAAAVFAVGLFSNRLFAGWGLNSIWCILLSALCALAIIFFFAFSGLYIGISLGALGMPVKRLYLYPYELSLVETHLRILGIKIL